MELSIHRICVRSLITFPVWLFSPFSYDAKGLLSRFAGSDRLSLKIALYDIGELEPEVPVLQKPRDPSETSIR